ncbi:hypothetical protein FHU41_002097 [Psychromicrobium silvestre]|uniref:VOC domain-containing protein n=1 Tax=Psychromicrobium silvestre TaxID=1645614 RepID=A0A7Y9LUI3_9MICC|nr:VOC family protein [Psychromicrobium silvestre]NYE95847.1 hypothetical protein [Psychromicrobium silvestre]
MLRVRPIHFTSRVEAFLPLLDALGLVNDLAEQDWLEFSAGQGRLALHRVEAQSADDGVTYLGFEARDLEVFASRTREAGTQAELIQAAHGPTVQVTGGDGLQFLVDPSEQWEATAGANPLLSVNTLWYTSDVAGAAQDLRNIGAIPVATAINGRVDDFTAKNGGKILVHTAPTPRHGELGFGYLGALEELQEQLSQRGFTSHIIDETYGRTLHLPNPDFQELPNNPTGPTIWINEENQTDNYGYLKH